MKNFLEQNGYKQWKVDQDFAGEISVVTEHYQKRVDTLQGWEDASMCLCNDKLFIDIKVNYLSHPARKMRDSWSIGMEHESPINGEWVKLEIRGIDMDKVESLAKFEKKLYNLWKTFNEG